MIRSSARELGAPGFDRATGAGLADAASALVTPRPTVRAWFSAPTPGAIVVPVGEAVSIRGALVGAVAEAELAVGSGPDPGSFDPIPLTAPTPDVDGELARWDVAAREDGPYVLRLTVRGCRRQPRRRVPAAVARAQRAPAPVVARRARARAGDLGRPRGLGVGASARRRGARARAVRERLAIGRGVARRQWGGRSARGAPVRRSARVARRHDQRRRGALVPGRSERRVPRSDRRCGIGAPRRARSLRRQPGLVRGRGRRGAHARLPFRRRIVSAARASRERGASARPGAARGSAVVARAQPGGRRRGVHVRGLPRALRARAALHGAHRDPVRGARKRRSPGRGSAIRSRCSSAASARPANARGGGSGRSR